MGEDLLDLLLIERADGDRGGAGLLLLTQVSQPRVVLQVEGAAHQQESHVGVRPGLANQGGNRIEDLGPPAGYHTDRVQLLDDQQAIPTRSQASQDRNRGLLAPQQLAPDFRGPLSRIQPVEAKRQDRPTCVCDPTHDLTGGARLPRPGDRPMSLAGLLPFYLMRLDSTVGATQAKLDSVTLFSKGLQLNANGIVGQQPDELTDGPPQLVAVASLVRVAAWEWHRVRCTYREERDKPTVADGAKARYRYTPILGV